MLRSFREMGLAKVPEAKNTPEANSPLLESDIFQVSGKTNTYTVYVQQMNGKRTKMYVNDTMTLGKLKTDYAEYNGTYDASRVFLYFRGKCLVASNDSKTLKDLKIDAECVIHTKEPCTGGCSIYTKLN